MNITVRSIAVIKTLLGQGEMDVSVAEGSTVEDLLVRLVELAGADLVPYFTEPEEGSAYAPLRIMVNGRDIVALAGRRTILSAGDDVLIFTPIAGG